MCLLNGLLENEIFDSLKISFDLKLQSSEAILDIDSNHHFLKSISVSLSTTYAPTWKPIKVTAIALRSVLDHLVCAYTLALEAVFGVTNL